MTEANVRMMTRLVHCLAVMIGMLSCPWSSAPVFAMPDELFGDMMVSGEEGKPCPSPSKYDTVTFQPIGEPWQVGPDREKEEKEIIGRIHSMIFRSPRAGLELLVREIKQELRVVAAVMGIMGDKTGATIPESAKLLNSWSAATRDFTDPCMQFWETSGMILQERNSDPDRIRKIAEQGIDAFRKARAFPRQANVVYCTGIPLYSDSGLSVRIPGAQGIIMGLIDVQGKISEWRLYPTTRTHFTRGMPVSWHWNMVNIYGEIWYRDPNTDEVRQAFSSAAEFTGRDLREL